MANYQVGSDSDYEDDQLVGYESEQEFDEALEMMNKGGHNEFEQVESETESGSDEFDVSGYFVGKKVRRRGVYDFDDAIDSSVAFSGFGIELKETESESSSYESDVTSKPCILRDELNQVESRITCYDDAAATSDVPIECGSRVPCIKRRSISYKRDFPAGCGVGAVNLLDGNLAPESRLESDSIKTRNVSFKRDFPVGCGTSSVSSVPCIKKRKFSVKRDCSPPVGCQSIESGI